MRLFKKEKEKLKVQGSYKGYNLEYYSKEELIDRLLMKNIEIESLSIQIQKLDEKFDECLEKERNKLNDISEIHNQRLKMLNYISNMYEFTPLKKVNKYDDYRAFRYRCK